MKRKKKKFLKKSGAPEEMTLQITSMADIFTILLVFLLKSFSADITTIAPTADTLLPEAQAGSPMVEALKVEISKGAIFVDAKEAVKLNGFAFSHSDLDQDGTSRALNSALRREHARKPASADPKDASAKDTAKNANKLLVLADQATPYSTLKSVLDSAANSGYADFKLVVIEDK